MIGVRLEGTVLADLASNVFAVCLVTLLLLAALDRSRPASPEPPASALVLERDLRAVTRAPLAAVEMVEMLRARRPGAPGASLDVGGELRLTLGGSTRIVPADALDALAAELAAAGPVRLYVFGHGGYGSLTRRLAAAGVPWTEMSVPAALRREAGATTWAAGFLALLDRAEDAARFRAGLARLLAGGQGVESLGPGGTAPQGHAGMAGLVARLGAAARAAGEAAMLAVGALGVLAVERGRRRRARARGTFRPREPLG